MQADERMQKCKNLDSHGIYLTRKLPDTVALKSKEK